MSSEQRAIAVGGEGGAPLLADSARSGVLYSIYPIRPANYTFVIVNVPLPVHPPVPVNRHWPEIVLPLAVPLSVSVLPEGLPDWTLNPNLPFTVPLKFPLSVNEPVSVSPDTKHGEFVVNWKFDTASEPSPLTFSEVPKLNTVVVPPLINEAFQVPLMFEAFELFEPQPLSTIPISTTNAAPSRFMRNTPGSEVGRAHKPRCRNRRRGGFVPPIHRSP